MEITLEAAEICENLPAVQPSAGPQQADNDATLIRLWLHGRNRLTAAAYEADLRGFFAHVQKPIRGVTLADVQAWADTLSHQAAATRARKLASIRSLLTFATRLGYVPFNAGAPVRSPPVTGALAERILSEEDVIRMLAMEREPRNHALIRLLYIAGLRISEACGLRWKDCKARRPGGQITVLGKRSKLRAIVLPDSMWRELTALRGDAADEDPVFRSRQGEAICSMQAQRIVKAAAIRAGLSKNVSPHWLRHAHVSHALDRGAPAHLVQATVGHSDLKTTSRYSHARPSDSSARYLIG
jgi:integrase/recombinase XerD